MLLLVGFFFTVETWASSQQGVQRKKRYSLTMHPTSSLLWSDDEDEGGHRNLLASENLQRNSAVYASLVELPPSHPQAERHNSLRESWERHRHLSRFELQLRLQQKRSLLEDSADESRRELEQLVDTQPPSPNPSAGPTIQPTFQPTQNPTNGPTLVPTLAPTLGPTLVPTLLPTLGPTVLPTLAPTLAPTTNPTVPPTFLPSVSPTQEPTSEPTQDPTRNPTPIPGHPTQQPTFPLPTHQPSNEPTNEPTHQPSNEPTSEPTDPPSFNPTELPTDPPTLGPTLGPTEAPTEAPTERPTAEPAERRDEAQSSGEQQPSKTTVKTPPVVKIIRRTKSPSTAPTAPPSTAPTASAKDQESEPVVDNLDNAETPQANEGEDSQNELITVGDVEPEHPWDPLAPDVQGLNEDSAQNVADWGHDGNSEGGGNFNSFQTAPLFQGYGTHYASLYVGRPNPQRVSAIVDTGSHVTAFPCDGCSQCGHHTDPFFKRDASDTFRSMTCDECSNGAVCEAESCVLRQQYAEGSSWTAVQSSDFVFCGGSTTEETATMLGKDYAIDFRFGCQSSETGFFVDQLANGIMGMSQSEDTLPFRLWESNQLELNAFALCFRRKLQASRSGVTAGILTLGGVDERLHSSPMVFAKNTGKSHWYTVELKRAFLRASGGTSAIDETAWNQTLEELSVNLKHQNGGKGVVIDSGTTDCYFHPSLGLSFQKKWKTMTGVDYAVQEMILSDEQVRKLPTFLLQIRAYDAKPDPSVDYWERIPGLVGSHIDPGSPQDILLAIPATHYMEYSPKRKTYTPRIYFTERDGGVIGASALQGHDILFDSEYGRVGIAESSCDFDLLELMDDESASSGGPVGEEGVDEDFGADEEVDCRLAPKVLTSSCAESVDLSRCGGDMDMKLTGVEKWSRVVTNPGTSTGKSCDEVVVDAEEYKTGTSIGCGHQGLCQIYVPCSITCDQAQASLAAEASVAEGDDDDELIGKKCGDSLWGACEYSCEQTKVTSVIKGDKRCHEVNSETRTCHIDACGKYDPCIVPFRVHAVIGFAKGNDENFHMAHADIFAEAFARTINADKEPEDERIGPGDVKVLHVTPWIDEKEEWDWEDTEEKHKGLKLVCEVSIPNPAVEMPTASTADMAMEKVEDLQGVSNGGSAPSGGTTNTPTSDRHIKDSKSRIFDFLKKNGATPKAICDEDDTLRLARDALDVHKELERRDFMVQLVENLRKEESLAFSDDADIDITVESPFASVYKKEHNVQRSEMLSSWTVRAEVEPPLAFVGGSGSKKFVTVVVSVLILFCCFVCCCGMVIGAFVLRPLRASVEYKPLNLNGTGDEDDGDYSEDDDDAHDAFEGDRQGLMPRSRYSDEEPTSRLEIELPKFSAKKDSDADKEITEGKGASNAVQNGSDIEDLLKLTDDLLDEPGDATDGIKMV